MKFFLLLVQMIPALIATVKQIETLIPGKGQGPAKLNLVLNTVDAAAKSAGEVAVAIEGHDLKGAVTNIVNTAVATMKETGLFTSGTEPKP